jgi:NAD+ synthase
MKPIDTKMTVEAVADFIKSAFATAGFAKAVIGVSGGIDSAVSCALSVRALGQANVFPVLMPYGVLSTSGTLAAMSFVQGLNIPISNIVRIDIKPAVDVLAPALGSVDNARRGNLMARMRMTVLFDQAKKRQALVVGTENKSEHLLGYFTRFGDEASDIEPIRQFYKTHVYELARYLNIPDAILQAKPTAGLWPEQTDEGEFGFTYKEADEILSSLYDDKKSVAEVIAAGFPENTVRKVKTRVDANMFKQNLPYLFRETKP